MSMADYEKQAALVVRVLPEIEKEPCFAIKGGTAINLFELNLPRLSVDIDLTFMKIAGREQSIAEINEVLERMSRNLERHGIDATLSGAANARKIYCSANRVVIKVEPNFIFRGTAFPVRKMEVCEKAQERFGMARMQVLSFQELYGGKLCAALDRQHPRDLFDMAQFYKTHSLQEIKDGFLVLALGHNRPLHELLAPMAKDQFTTFEQQFSGMAEEPFSYDEHQITLARLAKDVLSLLDGEDRQRLLDFVSLLDAPGDFGIPHFDDLPAIRWKRHNLELLKTSNPARFALQREALERLFEKEHHGAP